MAPSGVKQSNLKKNKDKVPEHLLQKGKVDRSDVHAATEMTKEEFQQLQVGMNEKWPLPAYMNGEKGHMSFKDDTFYAITRWMAETEIEYRPHAKSPGSKSHLRYERYSKAKTVGEALELGSYPVDWCWDFERGFLRATGGPTRSEPLDIAKEDEDEVTEVDKAVNGWYIRELAKALGMKQSELAADVPAGEGCIMRGLRLLAQREAKERLETADMEGRMVTNDEVLATLKRWVFYRNNTRKNVMQEGETWVHSDTMGMLRDRQGDLHLTPITRRYPQVAEIFGRWLADRLPAECKEFAFTSMNVNCNYAASIHRDAGNFGPSFIKAFGEFGGGNLNYWAEDNAKDSLETLKKSHKPMSLNLADGLCLFNGNCAHDVDAFQGSRYSIVYFAIGAHPKIEDDDRQNLTRMCMPPPTPNCDRYRLLREPGGYNAKDQATPSKGKPAFRFYLDKDLPCNRTAAQIKKTAKAVAAKRVEPENKRSFYGTYERRVKKGYMTREEADAMMQEE